MNGRFKYSDDDMKANDKYRLTRDTVFTIGDDGRHITVADDEEVMIRELEVVAPVDRPVFRVHFKFSGYHEVFEGDENLVIAVGWLDFIGLPDLTQWFTEHTDGGS